MTPLRAAATLLAFAALGLGATALLKREPAQPPSPFVGRPAPPLVAPLLADPARPFDPATLHGKPWVLNVWASWCAPCNEEHPLLVDFARRTGATVVGLNFADQRNAALGWLKLRGDPYAATLHDPEGSAAAAWGVAGVPQTFVIDAAGIVRVHHVGRLTERALREAVEPVIAPLSREQLKAP